MAMARFVAVVVLPSPSSEDVINTAFDLWLTCANCRLVRIWRNDSARGLWAAAWVRSGFLRASLSKDIPPRTGASDTRRRSASPRTAVSKFVRRTAAPTPTAVPISNPSSRLRFVAGAEGSSGADAGVTTESLTSELPSAEGRSRLATVLMRLSPTACAIAAACTGDSFSAEIVMMTVLRSALAATCLARAAGVVSRPRLSIAGCSTEGVPTV